MNPKRATALLLMIFGIMTPYFGFVIYFALQYPSGKWPTWFVNTLGVWFIANFLIIMLLVKRFAKGQVVETEKAGIASARSKSYGTRLLIVLGIFLIYGLIETIRRKIPLDRAVLAGVFLAFFIGIFGWSTYRMRRKD